MLWTVARQAPLSMGFSRQEYWNRFPRPLPEDLPDPEFEPVSLTSSALGGGFFTTSTTWERKSESEVAQSCPILCDPMDCNLPGSSIHGIFQARVLEWVAISFFRGSSPPRDQTLASRIAGRCFMFSATREAQHHLGSPHTFLVGPNLLKKILAYNYCSRIFINSISFLSQKCP